MRAFTRIALPVDRIGILTVIRVAGHPLNKPRMTKEPMYLCRRDRGKEKIIAKRNLLDRPGKSCGCLKIATIRKVNIGKPSTYKIKDRSRISLKNLLGSYRCAARNNSRQFDLDIEQFELLTSLQCLYCRRPTEQRHRFKDGVYVYNGFDRVDSARGYTSDNVVPCCIRCNRMKTNMSYKEFIGQIMKIAALHGVNHGNS